MYDSSSIRNVDNFDLEQPGETAYAAQMAACERALRGIFGATELPDQIHSPVDLMLFAN